MFFREQYENTIVDGLLKTGNSTQAFAIYLSSRKCWRGILKVLFNYITRSLILKFIIKLLSFMVIQGIQLFRNSLAKVNFSFCYQRFVGYIHFCFKGSRIKAGSILTTWKTFSVPNLCEWPSNELLKRIGCHASYHHRRFRDETLGIWTFGKLSIVIFNEVVLL